MTTSLRFGKWTSVALMASAVLAAVPAWGAVTGSGDERLAFLEAG